MSNNSIELDTWVHARFYALAASLAQGRALEAAENDSFKAGVEACGGNEFVFVCVFWGL